MTTAATARKTGSAGRIPETQAEAATKEAAVDGRTSHRIEVKFPKGSPFEASLLAFKPLGSGGEWWVWSADLKSPVGGESRRFAPEQKYPREEPAVEAAFAKVRAWLEGQRDCSGMSLKVREALAAVDTHQTRILGKPPAIATPSKAPPAKPAVPLAARVNSAPQQLVELAKITASADNMRKDFDPAGLQELANSIKDHGLEQPMLVRKEGDGWDLIAGERRLRAGRLAKVKELPCRVVDCTPAEAKTLRMVENLKRRDLSAIEEAIGYQTLLAEGYTQAQVGEQVDVSQPTVANRLRLLKLPKSWQDRIIQREITESHARGMVDYAELPQQVVDHIDKALSKELKEDGLPPLSEWTQWLYRIAGDVLRECDPGEYYSFHDDNRKYCSGQVLFTEKHLKEWADELQLVTLKAPWGQKKPVRFAANAKRWGELHGQLQQEKAERAAKSAGSGTAKAKTGDNRTPAQIAKRTEQLAEQYKNRIRRYRQTWIQQTTAARCEKMTDDQLLRLLIGFAGMHDNRRRRGRELVDVIEKHGGKRKSADYSVRELLSVLSVPGKSLLDVAREAVTLWVQHDVEEYDTALRSEDLPAFVEIFSIDLAKEWRIDEAFLLLHSKDQIAELRKEWKLTGEIPANAKRSDVIALVLADDKKKRLPAPKVLLKGGAK